VAVAEAHRSGMCGRSRREQSGFASDIENLTLASPHVNRELKGAKDASDWLPKRNRCWFASRIVSVKKKYRLSVDRDERKALMRVLKSCADTRMHKLKCRRP